MALYHNRILAVIDPLPSGEFMARQVVTILRQTQANHLLWVTLCDDLGPAFESCHAPFMTPMQWLQRTEADLQKRLRELLQHLGVDSCAFKLLTGAPNRVISELSAEWYADLILASTTDMDKITGHNTLKWLQSPLPLTGKVLAVPPHSFHPTRTGWNRLCNSRFLQRITKGVNLT
ncbi:MAG: universal stress protein [Magnetococcales bacterium]|nr:universal stress protein [Magnetococcales bacterium]MBF0437997.1 universal stress protein [Magnetococcales bacterium]